MSTEIHHTITYGRSHLAMSRRAIFSQMRLRVLVVFVVCLAYSVQSDSADGPYFITYVGSACWGESMGARLPCLVEDEISFHASIDWPQDRLDWWFSGGTGTGSKRVFHQPGTYQARTNIGVPLFVEFPIVYGFGMPVVLSASEAGPAPVAVITIHCGAKPGTTSTIDYATFDETAMAGVHYVATAGTLTFLPGELKKQIVVPIINDDEFNHVSFGFSISNPSMGQIVGLPTLSIRIVDDEAPPRVDFVETDFSGSEGETIDMTLVRTGAPATAFTVSLEGAVSMKVDFGAGEMTKAFSARLRNDSCFLGPRDWSIALTHPTNGAIVSGRQATVHLTDDEPMPTFTIDDLTIAEERRIATAHLKVDGSLCYNVPIAYRSVDDTANAGSDYPAIDYVENHYMWFRDVIFIHVYDDPLMEPDETFFLEATPLWRSLPPGPTIRTKVTILNDDPPPAVHAIVPAATTPAMPGSDLHFDVAFALDVSGVDPSDFSTIETGVGGSRIVGVTGAGHDYDVAVRAGTRTPGTTSGSVALQLVDDDTIVDELGNPLGGAGAGNGNAVSAPVAVHLGETIPALDPAALALLAAMLAIVAFRTLRG